MTPTQDGYDDSEEPPAIYGQYNRASRRSRIYANQGSGSMHVNNYRERRRIGGWFFLALLIADVVFFFYGMTSYSGTNDSADTWHAGIFFLLIFLTGASLRGWLRRRW